MMQDKNRLLLLASLLLALGVIVVDSWLVTIPRLLGTLLLGAALLLLFIYWLRRPRGHRQQEFSAAADAERLSGQKQAADEDTRTATVSADKGAAEPKDGNAANMGDAPE